MALDLVSTPFIEAGPPPPKRRRLGWDVPDPALIAELARIQLHIASQLLQICPSLFSAQKKQTIGLSSDEGVDAFGGTLKTCETESKGLHSKGVHGGERHLGASASSPPWHADDKDGHFNFGLGDSLTSRYTILQKIGEGTFGRVLECWDEYAQEVVAIKVVRSAEKYREEAMIEVDVLRTLADKDRTGSRGKAHKYFRHERALNWPDRHTSRESIRAVHRLPRLRDLVMGHTGRPVGSLVDLLERMLSFDASERLTAKEALEHPFFQEG